MNSNLDFAPILLFTYKRPAVLKKTVEALQNNFFSRESDLYIFSDAAKNSQDEETIVEVRNYIRTIAGFKNVSIFEASENKGLAKSIIDGVSKIIRHQKKVIVLEDDLLTSKNFIAYMNQCLKIYETVPRVFSIAAFSPLSKIDIQYEYDVYFTPRNSSHGWGTWVDRWEKIDWNLNSYSEFIKNKTQQKKFNEGGSDLTSMLKRQVENKINSWSIRVSYHQFLTDTYSVYPVISKIKNIGFGEEATHTNNYNRFNVDIDKSEQLNFRLPNKVIMSTFFLKQFKNVHSLKARGVGKIKTMLYYLGLIKNK